MKKDFSVDIIEEELNKALDEIESNIVQGLHNIGEASLKYMVSTNSKSGKDYTDRTGNLRSSCGYAIGRDGVLVDISNFNVVKDGNQGAGKGKELATRIAISESVNKFCLVLVAGMEYATYVQKMGYDVVETAEIFAISKAKELTEILSNKYGK